MQHKIEEMEREESKMGEELEELRRRVGEAERESTEMRVKVLTLEQEKERRKDDVSNEEEMEAVLEREKVKAELEFAQGRLARMEQEAGAREEKIRQLEERSNNSETMRRKSELELAMRIELLEGVEKQKEEGFREREGLRQRIDELEDEKKALNGEIMTRQKEIIQLTNKVGKLDSLLVYEKEKNEGLKEDCSRMSEQLSSAAEEAR